MLLYISVKNKKDSNSKLVPLFCFLLFSGQLAHCWPAKVCFDSVYFNAVGQGGGWQSSLMSSIYTWRVYTVLTTGLAEMRLVWKERKRIDITTYDPTVKRRVIIIIPGMVKMYIDFGEHF